MKKRLSSEQLLPLLKDITENNGIFPLTVTGTSMTPTLYSERDIVNLVSPKNRIPKKYDIVLFVRNDGKVILHRIIKILPDNRFLINGDSQTWTEIICQTQIVAVAQSFIRNQKHISCNSFTMKLYSRVWCLFRPLRPLFFRLSSFLKKTLHNKSHQGQDP